MMNHLFTLSAAFFLSCNVWGDGKMFYTDPIPPDIPYQRAVLLFHDGMETLLLQSKYAFTGPASGSEIGWVVPVPSVPELDSLDPLQADDLFLRIGWNTGPRTFRFSHWLVQFIMLAELACVVGYLVLKTLPTSNTQVRWWAGRLRPVAKMCALWFLPAMLLIALALPSMQKARGSVEILDEQVVGRYHTQVIRADRPDELIAWLSENGFSFGPQDERAFASYIQKGWCFVTAKLNVGQENQVFLPEGLVDPLVLRFSTPQPVYPLALTATGGYDTEVLLYVIGNSEYHCEDRMTLRYAGTGLPHIRMEQDRLLPDGDFTNGTLILSKFRQVLTPEQMREDLVFYPKESHSPYRETVWKW
jgi:hypothetical protein